ncbi:type II toxin-antitoxin system RelE/ParE family toxin [Desulfolutivibrio sulfoxidireducens]|uniref:type II toxin-antitoxin system RelE/ParE family toxin n=1 Tax=Desulfolutivibrio sulfoxidireducens TaxID=2773299 RepID=UPI00159D2933|nr:type II toxin-antitoxin system RelE/ParE family toxin [Desulfolutivibrio sulfoxidireducens]QLA17338.1 type II toxin-antitoxin system mRNA interferase toxin, RelE/StbE family [Desulfolutivibrio sulfoxidireducens]
MAFKVMLTEDAVRDLEDIYDYIVAHDSQESAAHVLDQIEKAFQNLARLPERGAYPKELTAVGIRQFREVFFKPYRIVYQVLGETVYVMLIADGRRDMLALLQRRLLGA